MKGDRRYQELGVKKSGVGLFTTEINYVEHKVGRFGIGRVPNLEQRNYETDQSHGQMGLGDGLEGLGTEKRVTLVKKRVTKSTKMDFMGNFARTVFFFFAMLISRA